MMGKGERGPPDEDDFEERDEGEEEFEDKDFWESKEALTGEVVGN